jgi:folate-binding Fe-S cluster repair protein YgfZ
MKQWQEFDAARSETQATRDFICNADGLGLILVNGTDAREFLQNQLSNDIDFIDESHYQLSSYSTPKGRLVGIFRVIRITNGYILVTTRAMVLPLLERLYKYVVQAQGAKSGDLQVLAKTIPQLDGLIGRQAHQQETALFADRLELQ